VDRSSAWVWFGLGDGGTEPDLEAVRTIMAGSPDTRIALGRTGAGAAGFRESHRQALAARDVVSVSRTGSLVLAHDDRAVAVVAMLLHDIDSLARWVSAVLGPLAANTRNAERLRETLPAFLASGGSHQRTADRMQLHRNTVKYRITRSLEVRGRGLGDDRLDVELALEVVRLLGDAVLR
jgi:DNA-binding PucR family transcriptional regulator